MKRMFFLALALLLSVAPVVGQQTDSATKTDWAWMWPDASIRQTYPNIHAMALDGKKNVFVSLVANDTIDGLYASQDSGQTFSKVPASAFGPQFSLTGAYMIWSLCAADSNVLLVGADQEMFRSTDAGKTWQQVLTNPYERYSSLIHYKGDTVFAGGGFGIYRSIDNGITWTNVDSNNINVPFAYRKFNYITCFTVAANGYIYAGTGSGLGTYSYGILRSTDGGNTWTYANNGITNSVPDTTDWNADIAALAAVGDTVFAASTTLYRSTDNGASWQAMSTRFYNNEGGAMINTTHGLIVPTLNNLWLTTDCGETWNNLMTFQQPINVWSAAQWDSDRVLMGMWNGLAVLTIGDLTPVIEHPPVATQFQLSQNYPNPFNPTTQINYTISKRNLVTLTVYNVLGQKVATLVDGMKAPGSYTATFDGSRFSSGIYFYRLQAGNFSKTEKMELLK